MYQLIETIKLNDGIPENLDYHNLRFNRARNDLFGIPDAFDLTREIMVPIEFRKGLVKCRIIYAETIEKIQYEPYSLKQVKTLRLVYDDSISYSYKFRNRDHLNQLFSFRRQADDVIIIKSGWITDSSICNLVFENADGLYTPSTPLLKGTKREKLIFEKIIIEKEIRKNELQEYQKVHLINAFLDPEDLVINVKNILF
jgi:4-amino-4-deoxychorismate lyase